MSFRKGLADVMQQHGVENAEQTANIVADEMALHMHRNKHVLANMIAEIGRRFQAGNPPSREELEEMGKVAARLP